MKNKKLILVLVAFVATVAIASGVWLATRDKAQEGEKSFTVTVVHSDGSEKTFRYTTDAKLLGQFLYDEGLLIADADNPGMFHTVDGEKADYSVNQSWWKVFIDGQEANQGVETTYIQDGAVYKLVYTIGF